MPDGKKDADQFCSICGLQKSRPSAPGSITGYMFDPVRCKCTAEGGSDKTLKPASAANRTFAAVGAGDISELNLPEGAIVGGSYSILELIGYGGMGVVYQARHTALGKRCAIKLLPPDQVTSTAWGRFQLEAKSVAGLDHKNIVKVTDLGLHKGYLPFYAMEYVKGQSLAQRLAAGTLKLEEALPIFIQICDGIDYAHRAGIIHRDLKPANIMLGLDGVVKILDFGLAKLAHQNRHEQSLTSVGDIFGSPYYMSPEQCAGLKVDNRSDIYSLGCTLFECLSGRPPFEGSVSAAVMFAQQESHPPSISSCVGKGLVPDSIEIIMAKILRKNPVERYQTCRELMLDLERVSRGQQVQPVYVSRAVKTSSEAVPENAPEQRLSPLPKIFLAAASVMTLVGVSIGLGFYLNPKPRAVARPSKDFLPSLNTPLLVSSHDFADNKKRLAGQPASAAQKEFYSSDDSVGKAVKTFNFPIDARLGTIGNMQVSDSAAVGRVILDTHNLTLGPGPASINHPQYLSRFRPGEIQKIMFSSQNFDLVPDEADVNFEDINACCHALTFLPDWQHLPGLAFWHLNQTLNQDSIKILRSLTDLHTLEVAGPASDCVNLSAMPYMRTLKGLELSGVSDNLSFFKALENSPHFTLLAIDRIDFSDTELKALANLPKLDTLQVLTEPVSSVQIARLSSLKALKNLSISYYSLRSLEAIKSLKLLPSLRLLHVTNVPSSDVAKIDLLRHSLPGVVVNFEERAYVH